ncbi:NADPH-dependent F420 reductase [Stenotrophomonas rhizophila]|uniref:NADPH-dependent F420 reductase n=1 Tax=Stenotrophomonas rhizophila TaxID=216778 RepID=UPI001C7D76D0|nr:NAD(P)-binding domain-containing protein [Stenotrophomonas rhizophila]
MKIGILGPGSIGATLARRLATAGHGLTIANSRGPEAIAATALETGACAATADGTLAGVDVAILSMPHSAFEKVRPFIVAPPAKTVVIDTANHLPVRDGSNPEMQAGQVESEWVQDFFGRPVAKVWNAIAAGPFAGNASPEGDPDHIAVAIAADRENDREVAMMLINDTGFHGFDAGVLAQSWRQQSGSPIYCTNLRFE